MLSTAHLLSRLLPTSITSRLRKLSNQYYHHHKAARCTNSGSLFYPRSALAKLLTVGKDCVHFAPIIAISPFLAHFFHYLCIVAPMDWSQDKEKPTQSWYNFPNMWSKQVELTSTKIIVEQKFLLLWKNSKRNCHIQCLYIE